jgi:hypothetical protein
MLPVPAKLTILGACLALLPFTATAADVKPEKPEKPEKPAVAPGNGSGQAAPADGAPAGADVKPEKDKPATPDTPAGTGEPKAAAPLPGGAVLQGRDSQPVGDPAHTVLGKSVGATPSGGSVLVKTPGTDHYARLSADSPLPVGSVVDARKGSVELGSETSTGSEQHVVVGGSVFAIRQNPALKGTTDLVLQGGDFSACRTPRSGIARAASRSRAKTSDGVIRALWGSGKGRFRTKGRSATASVRGTQWVTVDRCHGTTVRVIEGVVDVRDHARGTTVAVRAGGRRVVRARASR